MSEVDAMFHRRQSSKSVAMCHDMCPDGGTEGGGGVLSPEAAAKAARAGCRFERFD